MPHAPTWIRGGLALLFIAVVASAYSGPLAPNATVQESFYSSHPAPATRYYQDSNGDWHGQTTEGDDWNSGARYADCAPMSSCEGSGDRLGSCNTCHSRTQLQDRSYMATVDRRRHITVHFPKLYLRLQTGQRVGWGPNVVLRLKGTEIVVTRNVDGRDIAAFPAGTAILRNTRGTPAFVVFPAAGVPRSLLR